MPTVLRRTAVSYLSHLADVVQISAERLWALSHDPQAAIIATTPTSSEKPAHYVQQ